MNFEQRQAKLSLVFDYNFSSVEEKYLTEAQQLEQNVHEARWFHNPSTLVQLKAVQDMYANAIKYFSNPSEQVQLASVERNPSSIKWIQFPTEKVCLEAIRKDGRVIEYIKIPTEEMCMLAVKTDPSDGAVLKYIDNPSEAVQLEAVSRKYHFYISRINTRFFNNAIFHIENPSEAVIQADKKAMGKLFHKREIPPKTLEEQLQAVVFSNAIQHIRNPSEKVCIASVKNHPTTIQFIRNPSEAVQMEIVKNDLLCAVFIQNPTEAVQFEMIKINPQMAAKICNNPTEAVCREILRMDVDAFSYIPRHVIDKIIIRHDFKTVMEELKAFPGVGVDYFEALGRWSAKYV